MRNLVLLLLLVLSQTVRAEPAPYQIDLNKGSVNLVPFLEYNIGNDDPLETPPIEGWSTLPEDFIKFGYDDRVHWFRFGLQNINPNPTSLYIELDNALLDNVTVYTLHNGKVRSVQNLGDNYSFVLRPVLQETFIIPISLLTDESLEFYIAVQSQGTVNFPLTLWQKESFQQQENYDRLLAGLFIGIIAAAVFAYLIVFIFSQSKNALLDAALMMSLLMITLTMNGYAFHYIWPEYPLMQQHAVYVFSCIAMACSALLARNYIHSVHASHPLTHSFVGIAIGAIIILPLTLFVSYQWGLFLVMFAAITLCCFHIYSGFWLWKQGVHEDQDLNLGVAVLLAAMLFIAVNSFTEANLPFTNLDLLQLAMLVLVTILSVSMIKKRMEKDHETPFSLAHEDFEQSDDLQTQLAEQNLELQLTLRELEDRNNELEKINTLDALSGIHNRRHFDKRIQAEIRRSRRELTPLSLIMFDIDHFKAVNDKFGHVAGDEVIRTVAHTGEEQLNRSSDEIFRYGGEEFAMLLPNTDLAGAEVLAEKVRKNIEEAKIATSSGTVTCTVSLGVACTKKEHNLTPDQFVELSDKALYAAKNNGRNCVVVHKIED